MGNSWKFMERFHESVDNSWEIHGKRLRRFWAFMEIHGNSWKIHGNQFMEIHGKFMEFMEFMEKSWKDSCKIHGKFMEIHGKIP